MSIEPNTYTSTIIPKQALHWWGPAFLSTLKLSSTLRVLQFEWNLTHRTILVFQVFLMQIKNERLFCLGGNNGWLKIVSYRYNQSNKIKSAFPINSFHRIKDDIVLTCMMLEGLLKQSKGIFQLQRKWLHFLWLFFIVNYL